MLHYYPSDVLIAEKPGAEGAAVGGVSPGVALCIKIPDGAYPSRYRLRWEEQEAYGFCGVYLHARPTVVTVHTNCEPHEVPPDIPGYYPYEILPWAGVSAGCFLKRLNEAPGKEWVERVADIGPGEKGRCFCLVVDRGSGPIRYRNIRLYGSPATRVFVAGDRVCFGETEYACVKDPERPPSVRQACHGATIVKLRIPPGIYAESLRLKYEVRVWGYYDWNVLFWSRTPITTRVRCQSEPFAGWVCYEQCRGTGGICGVLPVPKCEEARSAHRPWRSYSVDLRRWFHPGDTIYIVKNAPILNKYGGRWYGRPKRRRIPYLWWWRWWTYHEAELELRNVRLCGMAKEYDVTACNAFDWIADAIDAIAGWVRDTGERVSSVWFVGDIVGGWLGSIATKLDSASGWIRTLKDTCEDVLHSKISIEVWEAVHDFFLDPVGYIRRALGDVWETMQEIAANFEQKVLDVLGGTWNTLQDIAANFRQKVLDVLGDTWNILQDIAANFRQKVLDVLGDTWNILQDIASNFEQWVKSALGDTWVWLEEFVQDPLGKLGMDIREAVRDAFDWLTEQWFAFLDASWDQFRDTVKYIANRVLREIGKDLEYFDEAIMWIVGWVLKRIGDLAEDLAEVIWDTTEKVVKKL